MSNQLLNPLIHPQSFETLAACGDCLTLLYETFEDDDSINHLSRRAKNGIQLFIECVLQATDFETERAENAGQFVQAREELTDLEISLFEVLGAQFAADRKGVSGVVDITKQDK